MKPHTEARQQRDRQTKTCYPRCEPVDPKPLMELTEEQNAVLDCLRMAGSGLTLKQLETRTACAAPVLHDALEELLRQDLVARLNTLIPSYADRYPDHQASAE